MRRRIDRISSGSGSTERAAEWTVWLTDDDEVRGLNRRFRARDRTTDVLSFPLGPLPALAGPAAPAPLLGDVVVSVEQAARQAPDGRLEHELLRLVIHGFCHLQGHDHERGADARRMRAQEDALLARLGVAAGLVTRAGRGAGRALLLLLAVGALAGACASSRSKLDTLDPIDQARFSACRLEVLPQLCRAPSSAAERACVREAAALYAAEPARQRRRWLIDYGCSRAALEGAERGAEAATVRAGGVRSEVRGKGQ